MEQVINVQQTIATHSTLIKFSPFIGFPQPNLECLHVTGMPFVSVSSKETTLHLGSLSPICPVMSMK
jgi:hypothetical protein